MNGAHTQPGLHGTSANKMLSFIYPKITNHPIYGSTSGDLIGDVPFISLSSKPRNYQVHVSEQSYVESLARELLVRARCLWEEELDEDILGKIQKVAQFVGFISPSIAEQRGTEFLLMTKFWISVQSSYDWMDIAMDDLAGQKFTADEYENSKFSDILRTLGQAFRKNSDSSEDDFPSMLPKVKAILPYIKAFVQDLREGVPNYKIRSKAFRKESEKGFYSIISMAGETESKDGPASNFSSNVVTGRTYLELGGVLNEADISLEIRKGDNFKGFVNAVSDSFALVYSVFELKQEIAIEKTKHSAILKLVWNGMKMEDAFDLYLGRTLNSLKDAHKAATALQMSYPGDINIEKYIECAEDFLNGQLYWYAHNSGFAIN